MDLQTIFISKSSLNVILLKLRQLTQSTQVIIAETEKRRALTLYNTQKQSIYNTELEDCLGKIYLKTLLNALLSEITQHPEETKGKLSVRTVGQ